MNFSLGPSFGISSLEVQIKCFFINPVFNVQMLDKKLQNYYTNTVKIFK